MILEHRDRYLEYASNAEYPGSLLTEDARRELDEIAKDPEFKVEEITKTDLEAMQAQRRH